LIKKLHKLKKKWQSGLLRGKVPILLKLIRVKEKQFIKGMQNWFKTKIKNVYNSPTKSQTY
jgi:hypothetical protein